MEANVRNKQFYRGKRVFVTGDTGYKGAWLTAVLHELQAEMTGYALEAPAGSLSEKIRIPYHVNHTDGDIRDFEKLRGCMSEAEPEIVIHLAAQAVVKDCFEHPRYTYETNVMGTVNLLEAVREIRSIRSVVIVTTDKVYENKGDGAVYKETDPLGGAEPYSASKTCMEYLSDSYKRSYLQTEERMCGIATVRASNVLGGGDHVQSRLIPSILRAVSEGKPFALRNPHQTRPWQSMMDALNGYLTVGRLLYEDPVTYSQPWNIGPLKDGIRRTDWVVLKMQEYYANARYIKGDALQAPESETLGLDISKALQKLDWRPLLSCDRMLYQIVEFYQMQEKGIPEQDICRKQIHDFFEITPECGGR